MNKPASRIAIRVRLPKEDEYEKRHFREEVVYRWDRILGFSTAILVIVAGAAWAARSWHSEERVPLAPQQASTTAIVDPVAAHSAGGESLATSSKPLPVEDRASMQLQPHAVPVKSENAIGPLSEPGSQAVKTAQRESHAKVAQPRQKIEEVARQVKVAESTVPQVTDTRAQSAELARVEVLSERVARAQLTNHMERREPTDHAEAIISMDASDELITVYFFTELEGLKGETIYHDWYLGDKRMARVTVRPQSDSIKAYSSKYIDRHMRGDWQIRVYTADGLSLARSEFAVR